MEDKDKEGEGESVQQFNSNFKEFYEKQNEAKRAARERSEAVRAQRERERLEMASGSIDDLFTEAGRVAKRRGEGKVSEEEEEESDDEEEEIVDLKTDADHKERQKEAEAKEQASKNKKKKEAILDPDDFVQTVDLTKKRRLPDVGLGDGEEEDGAEDFDAQAQAVSEAFAGDDVTSEFKSEKAAEVEKGRPKDLDLTLPGWGSWGGEGLKVSKRKRRRFTVRAPPPPKRRDENRGHLILSEKEDEKMKKHQVRTYFKIMSPKKKSCYRFQHIRCSLNVATKTD